MGYHDHPAQPRKKLGENGGGVLLRITDRGKKMSQFKVITVMKCLRINSVEKLDETEKTDVCR